MALFSRWLTQSHLSSSLIAPLPHLSSLRSMRMFFLIITGLFFFLTVGEVLIALAISGSAAFPWPPLSIILIWLCGIGISLGMERRWKPLVASRLAAASGDQRFLAEAQPQPNPEALAVPVTIVLRFSKKRLLVFGPLVILLLIGLADIGFFVMTWFQHLVTASIWWWLLALTMGAGALLLFVFVVVWRQRWIIEIHQEGMRSWVKSLGMTGKDVPMLFWQEARLFACYQRPGSWRKNSAWIYELSSPGQVVTWTWVQRKEVLSAREEPMLPFEEHQVQMQALCNLVAAKTGLSLSNLSAGHVPQ